MAIDRVDFCNEHVNSYVVYEEKYGCPLCREIEESGELQDKLDEAEEKISDLNDEVFELNREVKALKDRIDDLENQAWDHAD